MPKFPFLRLVDKRRRSKIKLELRLKLRFFLKNRHLLNLDLYRRPIWLSSSAPGDGKGSLSAFFIIFFPLTSELCKSQSNEQSRLTVGRTCTPPSPLRRDSPLKAASCVCLPAEAVRRHRRHHHHHRCCSFWVRSYLSSWLASSVRSRNQGEHMRMSFVIKAGSRPQNLSWGMHAVTVTALRDTLESLLYLERASNWHETRAAAKSHTAHHHSRWVHLGNMTVGLNMWYWSIWHFSFFFLYTSHLLSSS